MDDVLPSSVRHYRCDIIFVSNIADLASKICSPFGRLSILTTNVGIYLETTPAQTCHMFEVNTLAHYWLVQEFLPDMSKANLGMVVTVASMAGYTVRLNMVDYSAFKAV